MVFKVTFLNESLHIVKCFQILLLLANSLMLAQLSGAIYRFQFKMGVVQFKMGIVHFKMGIVHFKMGIVQFKMGIVPFKMGIVQFKMEKLL